MEELLNTLDAWAGWFMLGAVIGFCVVIIGNYFEKRKEGNEDL